MAIWCYKKAGLRTCDRLASSRGPIPERSSSSSAAGTGTGTRDAAVGAGSVDPDDPAGFVDGFDGFSDVRFELPLLRRRPFLAPCLRLEEKALLLTMN